MSTTPTQQIDPTMLTECGAAGRKAGVLHGLLFDGLLFGALACRDGTTEPGDDFLAMEEAVAMF